MLSILQNMSLYGKYASKMLKSVFTGVYSTSGFAGRPENVWSWTIQIVFPFSDNSSTCKLTFFPAPCPPPLTIRHISSLQCLLHHTPSILKSWSAVYNWIKSWNGKSSIIGFYWTPQESREMFKNCVLKHNGLLPTTVRKTTAKVERTKQTMHSCLYKDNL